MDNIATPILYSVGNIVMARWIGDQWVPGVVLEVDPGNAAKGGTLNYLIALIREGGVVSKLWFSNADLDLLDNGTAVV